jgi:phage baseplate assembly protein W
MALYKGFSTKSFKYSNPASIVGLQDNDFGPYSLIDKNLIIMDLINHFNIRKGEKLMNPGYGCMIWDRLFDPLTPTLKDAIVKDVSDIISSDPRISVLRRVIIDESADGHGLILDAEIVIKSTNEVVNLNLAFDGTSGVVQTTANY